MKYLRVLLIAVFFAMLSTAAHAAEQYIVYLRTDDSALLAAKDGMPAFSVVDADTLARLQSEDAVLWYEEDVEIRLTAAGYSDPYYIKKWDLTMIDAQSAWNMASRSASLTPVCSRTTPTLRRICCRPSAIWKVWMLQQIRSGTVPLSQG